MSGPGATPDPESSDGLPARQAALQVLLAVAEGERSDRVLDRVLSRAHLPERDRRLATEIVYGVLRRRRTLDRAVRPHVRGRLGSLDAEVREGLRMGAYQVAFLRSVPGHAAVDRTVEAVKRLRPRAAGFVNGVLRNWLRGGAELAEPGSMAERFDAPDWLAQRWEAGHGEAAAAAWLAASLEPPQMTLCPHPNVLDTAAAVEELAGSEVQVEPSPWVPGALRVLEGPVVASAVVRSGRASLRSEAAQLVTGLLPAGGEQVLDACCGRGGKSIQLAEADGKRRVVAVDLLGSALRQAAQQSRRAGVRLLPVAADLAHGVPLRGAFDRVLLDAPCSGLGTMRRHPEIKWRVQPDRLERLAALQRSLLESCLEALAPGGSLLYVTCSTEPEENEQVVQAVLQAHPEFRAEALVAGGPAAALAGDDGYFRTFPQAPDLDGFFAALLVRPHP